MTSQSMTDIEPCFRYCNTVWRQCNETLLDRLQTLQNRAARVIANVSYEAADHNGLLCDYGWLNVHNLILLDLDLFMYKVQKGLVPDGFTDLYHPVTGVHSYNARSANKGNLQMPLTNLRAGDNAVSGAGYFQEGTQGVSNQVAACTDTVPTCNKYFHSF